MLSAESSGREDFRWEGRRSCFGVRLPCARRVLAASMGLLSPIIKLTHHLYPPFSSGETEAQPVPSEEGAGPGLGLRAAVSVPPGLALWALRALSLLGPQFPPCPEEAGKVGPPRPLQYLLSIRDSLPCRPHPRPAFDLLVVPASRFPYLYGTAPGTTPTPHWHPEGRGGTPGRASLEVGRAGAERAGFSGVSHCPLGTGLAAGRHWEPARGGQMRRVGPGFPEARSFDGWFWWFLIREGRGGQNPWETGRRAEGRSRVGGQRRGGSRA